MYKFLDLCSGIGGGRFGLEQAGFKCIGYSDTSRLAKTTYNLLFDTKNEYFCNNIRKMDKCNTPYADILIAGFPCQTFSVIGRQEGTKDKRGQLIFTLSNIIKFMKPKAFIFENVKGLISHDKGKTYEIILHRLKSRGYKVYSKVLTTLDYGVPQMRQRIYFVGIRKDLPKSKDFKWPVPIKCKEFSKFILCDIPLNDYESNYICHYLKNGINNNKTKFEDLLKLDDCVIDTRMSDLRLYKNKMPTLRSQRDGIYYVHKNKIYTLSGIEALLFQGFPKEKVIQLENKVTNRHLLMQAGNAMSVNVIKAIGLELRKVL